MPTKDDLIAMAEEQAAAAGLDPTLLCALVEQESSWNPSASRYEAAFEKRYVGPLNLTPDESRSRATSFGLCQVLGEVARELGFVEDFEVLFDPEVNLYLGCKKLKHCLDIHGGIVRDGLLAYNGGGDHSYPNRVLARQLKYQSPATDIATTSMMEG